MFVTCFRVKQVSNTSLDHFISANIKQLNAN